MEAIIVLHLAIEFNGFFLQTGIIVNKVDPCATYFIPLLVINIINNWN